MRQANKGFLKALTKARRQASLKPLTPRERLAKAKRQKAKEREAAERTLTATGLTPKFAAKLQAAAKQAATDPEARAMLEKAQLAKRIDIAKRENGITERPVARRFMGVTIAEYETAANSVPGAAPVPPRLSETRAVPPEKPKKRSKHG